jgi:hypothetical protein
VEVLVMAPDSFAFLERLVAGETLGAAYSAVTDCVAAFDLGSQLTGLFRARIVTGV